MLLLDFCSIKKWDLESISKLYEDYPIQQHQGEPKGVVANCQTRNDKHQYILVENDRTKKLPKHDPDVFVIPSQPEFKNLWKYLKKSQIEYRKFLDSCIKGEFDLSYLNKLMRDVKNPEPAFFHLDFSNRKKKKAELLKWNPVLRLMGNGECIEDYIDLEIINETLIQSVMQQVNPQRPIFSRIRRCTYPACRRYFIAVRPATAKYCRPGDQCRYDHNNLLRKESGYFDKFQSAHRSGYKGVYQRSTKNTPSS